MTWYELIKKNEKKITKAMQKTNWDALTHKHMRFVVNMDEDGNVWTLEDVAGGNSFSSKVFNGTAIEIKVYDYQYWECNSPMEQKVYKEQFLNEDFNRLLKRFV